ncbi:hypothetical protein V491_02937, partial [Pseudogymnoascus sp. VKM F-3775]
FHADNDEPDQPEHEEDEGAEDYDAGEEGARVDEVEEEDYEGDAQGADGDVSIRRNSARCNRGATPTATRPLSSPFFVALFVFWGPVPGANRRATSVGQRGLAPRDLSGREGRASANQALIIDVI